MTAGAGASRGILWRGFPCERPFRPSRKDGPEIPMEGPGRLLNRLFLDN